MKTQERKFELAVFNTALARTDLVSQPVGGPMICTAKRSVTMERMFPQASRYEERMRNSRHSQIEGEQRRARRQAGIEIKSTQIPYD